MISLIDERTSFPYAKTEEHLFPFQIRTLKDDSDVGLASVRSHLLRKGTKVSIKRAGHLDSTFGSLEW